jgi:hypothetical protein
VPGTFSVSTASATPIDTNCVVQSMKIVSAPSGPLLPMTYDPATGLPAGGGTFCLCSTVGGQLRQWYNYDPWRNWSWIPNVAVPIVSQPPAAAPLV